MNYKNFNSGYNKYAPQAVFFVIFALLFILPLIGNLGLLNAGDGAQISTNSYEITAYDANISLSKDNVLTVIEDIDVFHNQVMHGIYRALPILQTVTFEGANEETISKDYKTKIRNVSANVPLKTYEENGIFYMRLGSEYTTVSGSKNYTITYDLHMGDDRYLEFDQFYYNILGTSWDTTISNFSFTLTLPEAIDLGEELTLYNGEYGSPDFVDVPVQPDGVTFTHTFANTFNAFEGVTARIVFEEGYLNSQRTFVWDYVVVAFIILSIILGFFIYQKYNNTKPLTPVVNFEVPQGMPPSEAGYIIDGIVDNEDIASLIVYWAQKGYLKIVDESKKTKKQILHLVKLQSSDENMNLYEKKIFDKIFGKEFKVKLTEIGKKIYEEVASAKTEIVKKHEKKNFDIKTIAARSAIIFLSVFVIALVNYKVNLTGVHIMSMFFGVILSVVLFLLGFGLSFKKDNQHKNKPKVSTGLIWFGILAVYTLFAFVVYEGYADPIALTFISLPVSLWLIILASKVNIRTNEGMDNLGQLVGFKQFILLTEKDRIKLLVNENPEMFYNVLPYAYVLGISDEWINKFEGIAIDPPNWYQTNNNFTIFDYLIMRSLLRSIMGSSISTVSYKPKNNNIRTNGTGGGFGGFGGGGGFTGGGFGGGGGGGW